MSAIHGLSNETKDILRKLTFKKEELFQQCDFYDQMWNDPVGKKLREKIAAFDVLTVNRECLVIAEVITTVFFIAIAPLFFLNRREKIGAVVAFLITGAPALFVTIGLLFDRFYLLPKYREKKSEIEDFKKRFPLTKELAQSMNTFAVNLSEFVKKQEKQSNLAQVKLDQLKVALQEVTMLDDYFSPLAS